MTTDTNSMLTAVALVKAAVADDRATIDALMPPGDPVPYGTASELVTVATIIGRASGAPDKCLLSVLDGITTAITRVIALGLDIDNPGGTT